MCTPKLSIDSYQILHSILFRICLWCARQCSKTVGIGCGRLVFVGVGMGGEGDGLVSFFPHSVAMVRHRRRPEGRGGIHEIMTE